MSPFVVTLDWSSYKRIQNTWVPSNLKIPPDLPFCPLGLTLYSWSHHSFFIKAAAATVAKSLQSCPTLCDPIDGSPPGSAVPGTLQARTLEWVAISFSNAWKWKVKVKSLSRVWLLATPWTTAYQAPPSMGFSRQEYWSEVPLFKWSQIPLMCKSSLTYKIIGSVVK